MDDQAYLEPGFDPSSLTVPRLRSIFVAHAVSYPASAKKQQLIDLFNENIAPRASKMKSDSLRVKRTSRGIIDMGTGRKTSVVSNGYDDYDDELPTTTPRGTRRSTRARTEEAQDVEPTPRSARHSTAPPERTPYKSSSKHARRSEALEEEESETKTKTPAAKRVKSTATTPAAKKEREDEESPFSNENVFQSGGSPVSRTYDVDRRRTTITSALRDADRSHTKEVRRRTEELKPSRTSVGSALVPSRYTYQAPVKNEEDDEEMEAGAEFTPDAEQEMIQAQLAGELVPVRRPARRQGGVAVRGAWAITLAMLAGLAGVWRQEKLEVGYCGVGHPSTEIAGVEIPEWADFVRPQCEPCPAHAYCGDKLETECEKGFVLTQHPLYLNGLVPIPPTCEPDSVKARKVDAVKQRAVEELREQNARYECGECPSPDMKESKLKEVISTQRRKDMSNEEFEDLWVSAIGEMGNVDEVISGSDEAGNSVLRSTSLARVPFSCAVRRSIRSTFRQYFWHLVSLLLVLSSGGYGRYRITSSRDTEARARQLATFALEKLGQQAALHAREPETFPEPFISMTQLRDDVLRDEFSPANRKKLWARVQSKVEQNSNVRSAVRESRLSGDVSRVWEWTGAVNYVESPQPAPASGDRRRSGRVSFAPSDRYLEQSSFDDGDSGAIVPNRNVGKVGKWQESSPYY